MRMCHCCLLKFIVFHILTDFFININSYFPFYYIQQCLVVRYLSNILSPKSKIGVYIVERIQKALSILVLVFWYKRSLKFVNVLLVHFICWKKKKQYSCCYSEYESSSTSGIKLSKYTMSSIFVKLDKFAIADLINLIYEMHF